MENSRETKLCPYCGKEVMATAIKCKHCGEWLNNANKQTQVIVNQVENKSNGIGTAGFVLSLVSLFGCWIPVANYVMSLLGLLFSLIGVFKKPRGLAIAGLIISSLDVIFAIVLGAIIASFFSALF